MYGNESSAVEEESHVVPLSANPSRMADRQKQQRTLEYLLKINRNRRSDKVKGKRKKKKHSADE